MNCDLWIVIKVNCAGMYSFITDDTHNIKALLDTRIKPLFYQRCYVIIDIFSRLAKESAKFLNA